MLASLAARYTLAQECVNQRLNAREDVGHGAADLETHGEAALDLMYEIAWQATELSARTIAGLKAKALILADWCEDRKVNLSDALAASLCADIKALADAMSASGLGQGEGLERGAA